MFIIRVTNIKFVFLSHFTINFENFVASHTKVTLLLFQFLMHFSHMAIRRNITLFLRHPVYCISKCNNFKIGEHEHQYLLHAMLLMSQSVFADNLLLRQMMRCPVPDGPVSQFQEDMERLFKHLIIIAGWALWNGEWCNTKHVALPVLAWGKLLMSLPLGGDGQFG